MNKTEYTQLCKAACHELDLDDPSTLIDHGIATIDGIDLGLLLDEENSNAIYCYVDLGAVESDLTSAVFEEILKLNLKLDGANGETIGFDSEDRHLYLRACITDCDSVDGTQLAQWLMDYVTFAKKLHQTILMPPLPEFSDALLMQRA